jgi:hypothetical protein
MSNTPANTIATPGNATPRTAAEDGAVVLTVTVVLPLPVTLSGLNEQVVRLGRPEHDDDVKSTVLPYPVCPVMVRMFVMEPPCATETLAVVGANVKSALMLTMTGEEELAE